MGTPHREQLYAHTPPKPDGEWHLLSDHLIAVAQQTKSFSKEFGLAKLGFFVGLLHDLGKANPHFQQYLVDQFAGITASPKVPHSVWGAAVAALRLGRRKYDGIWVEPVLAVLGHHSGLSARGTLGPSLENTLRQLTAGNAQESKAVIALYGALPAATSYKAELLLGTEPPQQECRELLLRMLFSALVDADRLDTERHFNRRKHSSRSSWWPLASLWPAFRGNQVGKMVSGRGTSQVNRVRREVYRACLRSAKLQPGVFRLAVPTGGGKTRSALAFALQHARVHAGHGFSRVIFALPYTSIVDQTVREYRSIFPGAGRVLLEHHSQIEMKDDESKQSAPERRRQLAEENWDAPLVVTTTVQLFESLLSDKPGRCRKIHNIARSVIVLDEVQALPSHILETTLSVLRGLVDRCGTTVVLCTATQPAFEETPYLKSFTGMDVRPIVSDLDAERHFKELRRVQYKWRSDKPTWETVAEKLAAHDAKQSMAVLNTRRDAFRLLAALETRSADA